MMVALAFFQLLSFGTLPPGARRHMTAAVTFVTAGGGAPKDFSSVRLFCYNVAKCLMIPCTFLLKMLANVCYNVAKRLMNPCTFFDY